VSEALCFALPKTEHSAITRIHIHKKSKSFLLLRENTVAAPPPPHPLASTASPVTLSANLTPS